MGFLGRLFGKKEEAIPELDIGKFPALEAGPGAGMPPEMGMPPSAGLTEMPGEMPNAPPAPLGMRGQPAPSSFAPAPAMQAPLAAPGADLSRDMQVLNAKIDTLKVLLDSINAKIDRIEQRQPKEEEPISLGVRRWR